LKNVSISQIEFDSSRKVREFDEAVIVPAILARECVSDYCSGRGYKPGPELKAATFTLDGAWVVVYEHIPTVNVRNRGVIRGRVKDVAFDDKINGVVGDVWFLKALCDEATLTKARNGELSKDVSCTYYSDDIYEPGKFADEAYDFKQTNFMFGHVAVGVPEGRCPSPFCGLQMDSFDGFLRVNVRDSGLFACRLSTLAVNVKDGVYALVGKLKKNLLPSGFASGDAVAREYLFDVSMGWTPEKAQAWVQEHQDAADAAWSAEYVGNLPDECFAYIEPGGKKDDEGKTVPRSNRHLEFKNAQGQIDRVHLTAALQALGGARTGEPLPYAGEAKGKLCAAVHSWNREHPADQIESSVCDGQGDSCGLDSVLVLARSRELLGNMPKGRKDVMTDAGWGVRHHDGAL
jgi:hypothetical protein